jgi:hypothetical protein
MNLGRYWLTGSAEKDLANIAKYTLETWGEKQLEIYRHRLEERLLCWLSSLNWGETIRCCAAISDTWWKASIISSTAVLALIWKSYGFCTVVPTSSASYPPTFDVEMVGHP